VLVIVIVIENSHLLVTRNRKNHLQTSASGIRDADLVLLLLFLLE
jgi:hypothetical protein